MPRHDHSDQDNQEMKHPQILSQTSVHPHVIWKIYIPSNMETNGDTSILIGWIDQVNHNIIIVSYMMNPIQLTNNDRKRNLLLHNLQCINHLNDTYFKCTIIGSTNIDDDCSDLMRIYLTNTWLQFDKKLILQQIISINKGDINDHYIIQYSPMDASNIFSPYYTWNHNDSTYSQILTLCNQSHHIHCYLHSSQNKQTINTSSLFLIHILSKYFQLIHSLYKYLYVFIISIPPLLLLSNPRIIGEITFNNAKFEQIIKYLKKNDKSDASFYNIHEKRKEILDIWSSITQHFINIALGIIFGYYLYFFMDEILQFISEYLKLFDFNAIKCHINYLMGIPIGLKLNANLNNIFASFSLFCLEILHVQIPFLLTKLSSSMVVTMDHNELLNIWDVFGVNDDTNNKMKCNANIGTDTFSLMNLIIIYMPLIKIYLVILSSCFGVTFIIALISDIISFLILPFQILHQFFLNLYQIETKMLSICGKLFRGLKYNELKHKIDKNVFDTDQLFIGIILFSGFTFVLPTVSVYFVYFSVIMIYIWSFQLMLDIIQIIVHYLSIASLIFLLLKPHFLCNGFDVCIQNNKDERLRIQLIARNFGIIGYFREMVNNIIMKTINKDIPHIIFIRTLKKNM